MLLHNVEQGNTQCFGPILVKFCVRDFHENVVCFEGILSQETYSILCGSYCGLYSCITGHILPWFCLTQFSYQMKQFSQGKIEGKPDRNGKV